MSPYQTSLFVWTKHVPNWSIKNNDAMQGTPKLPSFCHLKNIHRLIGLSFSFLPPSLYPSLPSLPPVGINNPPVPKTDTQEIENLDKTISLGQEGASLCSLLLSKHASTKWLTVAPLYIPDAVVPAPHLGFVQVKGSKSPLIG
jgi:hypothetical protein